MPETNKPALAIMFRPICCDVIRFFGHSSEIFL